MNTNDHTESAVATGRPRPRAHAGAGSARSAGASGAGRAGSRRAAVRVLLLAVAYLATVVLANWATATYGLMPAGFGLMVTAGTYAAGLALAVRDAVQDAAGARLAVALVVLGCVLSALLADGRIALASGAAFLLAELLDMAVYTPLRRRGRRRAVAVSNAVGALVDTVVFLLVAGFPLTAASLGGQLLVKAVWVTGAYLALVEVARRALPRDRVIPAGV
jgi:queuosine precursor transporter